MSSDSGSSTACASSEERRKRKASKKHKKKSEKKHKKQKKEKKEKRHKQRKRARHSSSISEGGNESAKAHVIALAPPRSVEDADQEVDAFGPALPPHLLQKQATNEPTVIGPALPSGFDKDKIAELAQSVMEATATVDDAPEDEDDGFGSFGPMPVPDNDQALLSATQIELEERALQLKLAAIDGASKTDIDQTVREEWMLELPEVGLKSGLAALNNLKRTFHQGKERPDFSDRSSWTKTPQDALNPKPNPSTSKSAAEALKQEAQSRFDRQRDDEQESIAKKHKKKHKREESLVELHQKKLRKEQKQREKELAASGAKPERRRFTRDVDLKLNKIDSNQTKQIVDKAKILNTKFSSGHTKYL